MIAMEAYAADCRLFGYVDLGEGRLTDFLNASPELRIQDARLESLADGHVTEAAELMVARDELCAVIAIGPRGDTARRLRTHATRVEVDLGPYQVVGEVHGTPASDPLGAVLRRAAWVPLTGVTVMYRLAVSSRSRTTSRPCSSTGTWRARSAPSTRRARSFPGTMRRCPARRCLLSSTGQAACGTTNARIEMRRIRNGRAPKRSEGTRDPGRLQQGRRSGNRRFPSPTT